MAGKTKNIRMKYEPLRSIAFGSIGASYAIIGSAFTNPICIIKIYNGTDEDVFLSTDGSTDEDLIPTGASFVIDVTANKTAEAFFLRAGDAYYAKQGPDGAPSTGSLYITAIYQG